jgi:NADH-quinone oxidoreductase subunit C
VTESSAEERPEAPAAQPLPEDIAEAAGDALLSGSAQGEGVELRVRPEAIAEVCRALRDHEGGRYEFLSSLAGVDYGDELGVTYHLYQLSRPAHAVIHVRLPRSDPRLPSVVDVFPAANWNEREAAELYGIVFEGHPDPRNLLLPDEWEGYPLRKDYVYPAGHPYLRPDPRHELDEGDEKVTGDG